VRKSGGAFEASVRSAIVVLAAWAAVQATRSGLPWSLSAVPVALLLVAASIQLCPAVVLERAGSARLRRVWHRRGDLASGLTLFAIAVLILLRHLG
jgi:hypothetical protein